MKKLLIMTIIFLGLSLNITAQETEISNEELLEKIEFLEAEIEKVKIEATDSSPMATGETLDWGTGLSFNNKISSESDVQVELMYHFPIKGLPFQEEYISKDKGRQLGIGLIYGMKYFHGVFFDDQVEDISETKKVGLKLDLSSPVMMNYISISTYVTPFFQFLMEDSHDASAVDFGLDVGVDINFWLNSKSAFHVGFMCDPSIASIYGDNDLQNPLDFKMTFGFKGTF